LRRRIEVALQGVTLHDHVVKVLINGTEFVFSTLPGQQNKVAQFLIGAGVLREGDNTVTLERTKRRHGHKPGGLSPPELFAHYQADHDYLQFTVSGRAQVSGFSAADVVLLDMTDPNAVSLYNPKTEKAADGYRFTLQTSGTRTFLALADQNVGTSSLTRNQPPTGARILTRRLRYHYAPKLSGTALSPGAVAPERRDVRCGS